MYYLSKELYFPSLAWVSDEGILAIGGDLSPERILLAYQKGIFPWFDKDEPILWWCPPKRMVVNPNDYKPPKSVRQLIKKNTFKITQNQAFDQVIRHCQNIKRQGQNGSWITDNMVESYLILHQQGHAKSFEVWQNDQLVGGLYGIDLGQIFCGDSMFSLVSGASKVAFISLIDYLKKNNYRLLDCQIYNDHLALMGAFEIERNLFLKLLHKKDDIEQ